MRKKRREYGELHIEISNDNKTFDRVHTFRVPLVKARNMVRRLAAMGILRAALNPN